MSDTPLDPVTGLPIPSTRTIAEIFELDPLKLSDKDFEEVIAYFRSDRLTYIAKRDEPKPAKAGKTPKATSIDVNDLFAD